MIHLGETIRSLRKGRHLSQEELAEHLQVSRQSVSKWESGTAYPDLEKVVSISRFFHVSTDFLLTGSSSYENNSFDSDCFHHTKIIQPQTQKKSPLFIIAVVLIAIGALSIWILTLSYALRDITYFYSTESVEYTGFMAYYMHNQGFFQFFIIIMSVGIILLFWKQFCRTSLYKKIHHLLFEIPKQ